MAYHLKSRVFSNLSRKNTPYEKISRFRSKRIRTTKYDIETPSYLGLRIWNLVPNEYKALVSHAGFKTKLKAWVLESCPCRLCKKYIDKSRILIKLSI